MKKVFIIAEAGVNHNGNIEIAKKMVDTAKEVGADAIKFQTFRASSIVCRNAPKAGYQIKATDMFESQLDMLKKLELTDEMHKELLAYCEYKKIVFLSTPFDIASMEYLYHLGLKIIKIPSGEITNYPYLKKAALLFDRIILSTGMSEMEEVEYAVKVLNCRNNEIVLLHCNSQYPTPMEDVNLKAMVFMKEKLKFPVGYSDHTMGIEVSVAAAALGAIVIEKHFTLDRNMKGPDHQASLEPDELRAMVKAIRNIEVALGDGKKRPTDSEKGNRDIVRKSIVAKRKIVEGEIFTEENITVKRPGTGISPIFWDELIGTRAKHKYDEDELIQL